MARIRTIKPEFFTSETVSALPLRARLTWIGLWTHCDDHGRSRANVKLIKAAVWPLDNVALRDIEDDLRALIALGLIFTYTADSKTYLQVTGWAEHQKVDRPSKSPNPAPTAEQEQKARESLASRSREDGYPQDDYPQAPPEPETPPDLQGRHSRDAREPSSSPREGLALERKGRERKGADSRGLASDADVGAKALPDQEPSPRCPKHLQDLNPPPCGACGDARRANDAWLTARRARIDAAPRCRIHTSEVADNCRLCRADAIAAPTGSFPLIVPRPR